MPHEIAKLLLEHASSVLERTEAVRSAIYLGMPMHEIEEYLDWLENVWGQRNASFDGDNGKPSHPGEPSSPKPISSEQPG